MKSAPFQRSSIDRDGIDDTNDCTVKALVMSTPGMDYATAHSIMAHFGRKPRKGMRSREAMDHLAKCTIDYSCRMSLGKFLKLRPTGRFYVHNRNHAFAIVDGTVLDYRARGCNTKILGAWEITGDAETMLDALHKISLTYNPTNSDHSPYMKTTPENIKSIELIDTIDTLKPGQWWDWSCEVELADGTLWEGTIQGDEHMQALETLELGDQIV